MPTSNHRRRPRPAGHVQRPLSAGHLGSRRAGTHGDLDHWFVKAEKAVGEYAKDVAHRGRQARRLVYKKRTPVNRHGSGRYVRVAGRGLVVVGRAAVGTAAVAVAGTYLTSRWTAQQTHRAYRAARPHVVHGFRVAHTNGVVYGGASYRKVAGWTKAANRRVVRSRARNRTRIRRMRYQAANRLDALHTQSIIRERPKVGVAAARAAAAVAPKTGRQHPARMFGGFSTRSSIAGRQAEDAAVQRAKDKLTNTTTTGSSGTGGSPVATIDDDAIRRATAAANANGQTPKVVPSAAEDEAIRRARQKLAGIDLGKTPTGDPEKEARKAGLPEATPGVWKAAEREMPEPPKRPTESAEHKRRRREIENHKMLRPDGYVPGWAGPHMDAEVPFVPDRKDVARQRKSGKKAGPVTKAKAERLDTPNAGGKTASAASKSISTTGGNMSNNPAAELNKGFALLADYSPADYQDWMQMLISVTHAMRLGAEAVTVLAQRMDIQENMDQRALQKLYLAGPNIGAVMQMFAGAVKDFWVLYNDRFEVSGARGRTMRDESKFFGQN